MKSKSLGSNYLLCIITGAVVGPLFPICFTAISGVPKHQGMADFIAYVSIPVIYLLTNILHTTCIPLCILLLMGYWSILGIGVSCSLVWLFSFILRQRGK